MICAICKQEFIGDEVEAIGDEGAEFFGCRSDEFVCFWCSMSANQERGDPFPWPWQGKA